MRQHLRKQVNLEDPTSLLDQVYLESSHQAAQDHNRIVMEKQKVFSKLMSTNTDAIRWSEKSQRHHCLDLRHGRSRLKVCWTLFRFGALDG